MNSHEANSDLSLAFIFAIFLSTVGGSALTAAISPIVAIVLAVLGGGLALLAVLTVIGTIVGWFDETFGRNPGRKVTTKTDPTF